MEAKQPHQTTVLVQLESNMKRNRTEPTSPCNQKVAQQRQALDHASLRTHMVEGDGGKFKKPGTPDSGGTCL